MCKFVGKIKQIIPFKGEIEKKYLFVGEFIKNYKSPIYDNELPIEWNTLVIENAGNKVYPYAPANRLKISSLVPTRNELANMKITLSYIRSDGTEAEYEFVCPYENIKWNDKQYVVATFENTEYNLKEYFTVVPKDEPIPHGLYWYTNNFSANDVTKGGWNYKLYVPDIPTDIYNGVELPDIETVWTDKETYPYAVIVSHPNGDYSLVLQSFEMYVQRYNNGAETLVTERNSGVLYAYRGSSNWTYNGEMNYNLTLIAGDTGEVHGTPLWASYDLKYVDEPSTPTGIYDDEFPIEWNSLAVVEAGNVTVETVQFGKLIKVSNLKPTAEELQSMNLTMVYGGDTYEFTFSGTEEDSNIGTLYGFAHAELPIVIATTVVTDSSIGKVGFYVMDFSSEGNIDFTLSLPVTATQYLYGREADSVVSYNGVTLPDIETVWTDEVKEEYPYAYIYPNGGDYYLGLTSLPMTYDSNLKYAIGVNYKNYYYKSTYTAWKSGSSGTLAEGGNNYATPLWSDYDILNSDNTTYLSASDPVRTYTDPDVFIGDVGYVGAVLPMLPEWDRETYPYAVMHKCDGSIFGEGYSGTLYQFAVMSKINGCMATEAPILQIESGTTYGMGYLTDSESIAQLFNEEAAELGFEVTVGVWTGLTYETWEDASANNLFFGQELVWSNYDVPDNNASGQYCISATDPIPVSSIVGYSYNGTVLPELPEWDKESYPYAIIQTAMFSGNGRTLYLFQGGAYYFDSSGTRYFGSNADNPIPSCTSTYDENSGTWNEFLCHDSGNVNVGGNTAVFGDILWANFDVIDEDGSIYRQGTESIPVYEKE